MHVMAILHFLGARLNDILFDVFSSTFVNISFNLNCSSEGGPVNQMLWLHNDEPVEYSSHFPTLANAETGLYYNYLSVHGRMTGRFTCRITNELNMTIESMNHEVKGKMLIMFYD